MVSFIKLSLLSLKREFMQVKTARELLFITCYTIFHTKRNVLFSPSKYDKIDLMRKVKLIISSLLLVIHLHHFKIEGNFHLIHDQISSFICLYSNEIFTYVFPTEYLFSKVLSQNFKNPITAQSQMWRLVYHQNNYMIPQSCIKTTNCAEEEVQNDEWTLLFLTASHYLPTHQQHD